MDVDISIYGYKTGGIAIESVVAQNGFDSKIPSNLDWITPTKTRIDWGSAGKAWLHLQKKTTSTSSPSSPFFTFMENVMLEICEERK